MSAAQQPLDPPQPESLAARLRERAHQRPPAHWPAVVMAGVVIGVCAPEVANFLVRLLPRCAMLDGRLVFDDRDLEPTERTALLFEAACRLRDGGMLRGWRDEPLDVRAQPDGAPIASIERAACRTLGITTVAVHLNAFTPDGRWWIARRALHKQIDPGLWDNLVGGMVPAGETPRQALVREAREEAGLDLDRLDVASGGRLHVRRPVPEGYQSEIVQVFDAVLPAQMQPQNEDGEVAQIEPRTGATVLRMIERDEFTLEAALVVLDHRLRSA